MPPYLERTAMSSVTSGFEHVQLLFGFEFMVLTSCLKIRDIESWRFIKNSGSLFLCPFWKVNQIETAHDFACLLIFIANVPIVFPKS